MPSLSCIIVWLAMHTSRSAHHTHTRCNQYLAQRAVASSGVVSRVSWDARGAAIKYRQKCLRETSPVIIEKEQHTNSHHHLDAWSPWAFVWQWLIPSTPHRLVDAAAAAELVAKVPSVRLCYHHRSPGRCLSFPLPLGSLGRAGTVELVKAAVSPRARVGPSVHLAEPIEDRAGFCSFSFGSTRLALLI